MTSTIRGIPLSKRWSPRTAPSPDVEVRALARTLVAALSEVRDGQVLAERHKKRLVCAIGDLESIANDHAAHVAAEGGARSRRTWTTSTTADVRAELRRIHSEAITPGPVVTTDDLAWDIIRLRDKRRST
jgi:hypothetical protein